ncbi:winged helix-turn-helix domain-containing protein [Streptomyces mirabilis]|uniref:winged helix-turn-helix domain-containing protein n=1 Tax=Streptomyces mirabilis TaxID=68239 RepID=UPI0036B27557
MRFETAELFAQGVARRLRVSRKSAYAWHSRWRYGGAAVQGAVRTPFAVKPERRPWLAAELGKEPATHGWTQDQRWALARVATVIARRVHLRFSPAQTWRILRQMGLSVQVPARRAAERDEEAATTWIKETWPRVDRR